MERITDFLKKRRTDGLLRTLTPATARGNGMIVRGGRRLLDFSSNDYLALSNHPALKHAAIEATKAWGTSAAASRLLSGDLTIHHELEDAVAAFKEKEAALVFNSGYQANVGIISALCGKGDAVFCDRTGHASMLDGIALSGAKLLRFAHNDADHLEQLLDKHAGSFRRRLIVTESIFSMNGQAAPLSTLADLAGRYDCLFMVDEAHATGIFGENGSGRVEQDGLTDRVDIIMGTFGKALGSFGAYAACSEPMKQYLLNTCRSFIYTTALPPSVMAASLAALHVVRTEPFRRRELLEHAACFREALASAGLHGTGDGQIVSVVIGDAARTVALSEALETQGFYACAIRPPTVAPGGSLLRFSLCYDHKRDDLERLARTLGKAVGR